MIIEIEEVNSQIDCEEYNKIYPEDVEFWAWVESMEQAYVKSITINQQS